MLKDHNWSFDFNVIIKRLKEHKNYLKRIIRINREHTFHYSQEVLKCDLLIRTLVQQIVYTEAQRTSEVCCGDSHKLQFRISTNNLLIRQFVLEKFTPPIVFREEDDQNNHIASCNDCLLELLSREEKQFDLPEASEQAVLCSVEESFWLDKLQITKECYNLVFNEIIHL